MTDKIEKIITPTKEYAPKKIAQRCPVCNGFGTLTHMKRVCHGCRGKGYVLVPVKEIDNG